MEIKFTPRARAEHSPPFLVVMANASTVRKKKKTKKRKRRKKGKVPARLVMGDDKAAVN